MPKCSHCGEEKENSEFYRDPTHKSGLSSFCKECNSEKGKERYSKNKGEDNDASRKYHLKHGDTIRASKRRYHQKHRPLLLVKMREGHLRRKYQMTTTQFNELLQLQNGVCAICGSDKPSHIKHLSVDHNHKTGAVRGLLCPSCNNLLANASDNTLVLATAIDYLNPKFIGKSVECDG
jgi:hypothetical protein